MDHAESVTFGGSGLNRAAELRADTAALDALAKAPTARAIALWRGKPLVIGEKAEGGLARLPLDHPIFVDANTNRIFLGLEGPDQAIFAMDVSAWVPSDMPKDALNSFMDQSLQYHPSASKDHVFAELRGVMTQLSARDAELAATARALFSWHGSHQFCAKCGHKSEPSQAGWQRDCPSCGAQHFPRTDPVVIMLITRGNKVLMGRSPGWPEGMYSLLAGFVEPGETIEAAVRREVFEEAGIETGKVSYLASQPWAFPTSLMFGCKGEALSEVIKIDPKEIEDAQWFTREDIMTAFSGQHPFLKPARKGAIAEFLLRNWLADTLD